jgi:hypothetical protein
LEASLSLLKRTRTDSKTSRKRFSTKRIRRR